MELHRRRIGTFHCGLLYYFVISKLSAMLGCANIFFNNWALVCYEHGYVVNRKARSSPPIVNFYREQTEAVNILVHVEQEQYIPIFFCQNIIPSL
jgi:hypothetical protein